VLVFDIVLAIPRLEKAMSETYSTWLEVELLFVHLVKPKIGC